MINKILSSILINSLVIYILIKYLKLGIGYKWELTFEVIILLWFIFWIIVDVIFKIIKAFSFPILFIFPILSLILNIVAIYLFIFIVNFLDIWVKLNVISIFSLIIFVIIISILNFIFKKL